MTEEDIDVGAGGDAGRHASHPPRTSHPLRIDVAKWGSPDRQQHPTHPLFLVLHSYGADETEFDEAMGLIAPHNDYVALRAPIALPVTADEGDAVGSGAAGRNPASECGAAPVADGANPAAEHDTAAGDGVDGAAASDRPGTVAQRLDHPGNVLAEGMVVPDAGTGTGASTGTGTGAPAQTPAPEGYGWFATMMPVGAELAADATAAALAVDEWVRVNVPDERPVVPIGFSQGAAVALHLLRVHPERYRAAVSLSGFHSSEEAPADARLAACDVAVFHGYGRNDKVVPRFELIATAAWLDEHTYLTTKSYPGLGHALNLSEITDLCNWLTAHDIITGVM